MQKEFTTKDGELFISLARESIQKYLQSRTALDKKCPEKRFEKKLGVFVTLHRFPSMDLRGCIGIPYPSMQLWRAIIEAATSAAFADPRFPEFTEKELVKTILEISILTEPQEIEWKENPEELLEKIKIGEDGLIVKNGYCSGLLLPQVAPEWKWGKKEFLENTCSKAGLPKNAWCERATTIQKFQAQIFKEKNPDCNEIIEE